MCNEGMGLKYWLCDVFTKYFVKSISDKTCKKKYSSLQEYSGFCAQIATVLDYNTDYQESYPFELMYTSVTIYNTISSKIQGCNLTSNVCPFTLLLLIVYPHKRLKRGLG